MDIPAQYKRTGVLKLKLQDAINENWSRIQPWYDELYEFLEKRGLKHISIEAKLLKKMRKDIRQDGPRFLETQDGIGSRLRDWIIDVLQDLRGD